MKQNKKIDRQNEINRQNETAYLCYTIMSLCFALSKIYNLNCL